MKTVCGISISLIYFVYSFKNINLLIGPQCVKCVTFVIMGGVEKCSYFSYNLIYIKAPVVSIWTFSHNHSLMNIRNMKSVLSTHV